MSIDVEIIKTMRDLFNIDLSPIPDEDNDVYQKRCVDLLEALSPKQQIEAKQTMISLLMLSQIKDRIPPVNQIISVRAH